MLLIKKNLFSAGHRGVALAGAESKSQGQRASDLKRALQDKPSQTPTQHKRDKQRENYRIAETFSIILFNGWTDRRRRRYMEQRERFRATWQRQTAGELTMEGVIAKQDPAVFGQCATVFRILTVAALQ